MPLLWLKNRQARRDERCLVIPNERRIPRVGAFRQRSYGGFFAITQRAEAIVSNADALVSHAEALFLFHGVVIRLCGGLQVVHNAVFSKTLNEKIAFSSDI